MKNLAWLLLLLSPLVAWALTWWTAWLVVIPGVLLLFWQEKRNKRQAPDSYLKEMAGLLGDNLAQAEQERQRLQQITQEAGSHLAVCLHRLKELLEQQNRLLEPESQQLRQLNDQLDEQLQAAIRPLQFEDLSTQMLAVIEQDIARLQTLVQALENALQTGFSTEESTRLLQQACHLCREDALNARRPVMQENLSAGEAELF